MITALLPNYIIMDKSSAKHYSNYELKISIIYHSISQQCYNSCSK